MTNHETSSQISVVAVDDHPLIRSGIRHILERQSDMTLVGEGAAGEEILPLMQTYYPDVLLLDISLPTQTDQTVRQGIQHPTAATVRQVCNAYPDTCIIIISQYDSPSLIRSMLSSGVQGYLLKDDGLTDILASAIRIVHAGGTYFSNEIQKILTSVDPKHLPQLNQRHIEVLSACFAGANLSRQEIAQSLNLSVHTLNRHLSTIYAVLGVSNMSAAFVRGLELGILTPPSRPTV